MTHPLFQEILHAFSLPSEEQRHECDAHEHDWEVTGYSQVKRMSVWPDDPADVPEFAYLRCRRCGLEEIESFQ